MPKLTDPWDHHDWSSRDYVARWAERQDEVEPERQEGFRLMARRLAPQRSAAIRILDIGAGYGALTQFLLDWYPNATAVCQDGSVEMARLGRKRMRHFGERFTYVLSDFSKPGWSRKIEGPVDAAVSSIAIHNVRRHETIRSIYNDIFRLVKSGGWFLNFDRMTPSLEEQLSWLKEAGFSDARCLWEGNRRAVIGGLKPAGCVDKSRGKNENRGRLRR